MSRKIYVSNEANLDASVIIESLPPVPAPPMGIPGEQVSFKRYLSSTDKCLHEPLSTTHGDDYAEALINGDPEVDMELVGKKLQNLTSVYVSSSGDLMYAAPKIEELILNPDGSERERKKPEDVDANVNDEYPIKWIGKKIPTGECCRKFFFRRSIQLKHIDGLTFDFLFKMAKQLEDEQVMTLVGTGKSGKDPLIFQANGKPYRAFLEGRTDGERFKLFLHLSDMELKRPEGG
jgi:hypothetical protein